MLIWLKSDIFNADLNNLRNQNKTFMVSIINLIRDQTKIL
jgi:hypothetical protein